MESIDKDVQAMLNSLKKYDKLNESFHFSTLNEKKPEWLEDSEKKAEENEDKAEDEDTDINESADKDVLEWMARFSKLGNMNPFSK